MTTSLYYLKDEYVNSFGIKPYNSSYNSKYKKLNHKICLKDFLGWKELDELQGTIRKANIWNKFLDRKLFLIATEGKFGVQS